MKKVILAVLLSLTLVVSLVGCKGGSTSDDETDKKDGDKITTEDNTVSEDEIVTLKWVQVGNGMPSNYDAWKKNIDAYLGEKIGVNLEMEVVSWGDWNNRRSVIVNTNEDYDILFTNADDYTSNVKLGAFYDIDQLVRSVTPDLYTSIPKDYWEASKVDGKVYAVPTYKDSSMTQYFVWDKDMADKYDVDYNSLTALSDLTEALATIKEGENAAPFVLNSNGLDAIMSRYDQMSVGLPAIGVRYDDDSRTVVSVFEQEDVMNDLKTLNDWYNQGIINSDAATLPENPAYRMCFVAQGWSRAAETTWGPQMGVPAVAVQWGDTIVSNDTVRGSLSCISSSCEYPEKALQLLELVNTDSYVRDALYYGLEGDNFEYTEDGKVNKFNNDWSMAGYTQGSFFTVSLLADDAVDQWEEVKELNANAKPSLLLGFTFDTTEVEDELANCVEIYNRYKSELITGTKEPEAEVAAMMSEMRSAGFDKIVEAAQQQINESY